MRKLKGASVQSKKIPTFKITGNLKSDVINMNDEIEGVFTLQVAHCFATRKLTPN